jgi:hypothetical protein
MATEKWPEKGPGQIESALGIGMLFAFAIPEAHENYMNTVLSIILQLLAVNVP